MRITPVYIIINEISFLLFLGFICRIEAISTVFVKAKEVNVCKFNNILIKHYKI